MSTITSTPAAAIRAVPARSSNAPSAAESEAAVEPEKQRPSVTLTLSDYTRKRMQTMREATAKMRAMQSAQQEARKDAARQRLEDIKRRIEMLKQLVMALGPAAAKGALRQIKQLAEELGQAASVLKEPSNGGAVTLDAGAASAPGGGSAVATETATVVEPASAVPPEVEADPQTLPAAAAAEQAAAENEEDGDGAEGGEQGETTLERARHDRDDQQRRDDADELKKVARQLRQLLAMVKAQLSAQPDEESRKLVGDIGKQLADVEKAASDIGGGGVAVSAAVGATLSISV